jgi:hypothetical protein
MPSPPFPPPAVVGPRFRRYASIENHQHEAETVRAEGYAGESFGLLFTFVRLSLACVRA